MDEVVEALEKYQGLVPLVYDIETMSLDKARPEDMPYAVYLKREADKVIADLDESHKKEVGQLLIKIAELKEKRDTAGKLLNKALDCVSNGKNHMMSLARKNNHANYKRCLAMAMWCWGVKELNRYGDQDYMDFAEKWRKRWLEIATKFKEAK